ncbi:MAG: hypothetical protein KHZ62_03275 [Clostridiales bacterium]|nr:hypothetical protein [Clostridiales bacterium]
MKKYDQAIEMISYTKKNDMMIPYKFIYFDGQAGVKVRIIKVIKITDTWVANHPIKSYTCIYEKRGMEATCQVYFDKTFFNWVLVTI